MRRLSIVFVFCLVLQFVAAGVVLAGDATSFNPVPIPVASKGAGGVPVGTIVAWPVAKNPEDMDNWLECNGQTVSATVYPELFALVGPKVPDFRGLFLRGVGGNSAGLGILQADLVGNHQHIVSILSGDGYGNGIPGLDQTDEAWRPHADFETTSGKNMGIETRPANKSVRYFIRAKQ